MGKFSHIDELGDVKMVDVSGKIPTLRIARAEGTIKVHESTINAIQSGVLPKGNVLTTAKIAGIQAAKNTSNIIPMCHQLILSLVDIKFKLLKNQITIQSIVKTQESTGVEMEALTAVSVSALTIYDMCKSIDKTITINSIRLLRKSGGKTDYALEYKPAIGIITMSDSISSGKSKDSSGPILINGFSESGCKTEHVKVLPDGSKELMPIIESWIKDGVELIITTGGTGLGPRDLTIQLLENNFDTKLPGIEQALHAHSRKNVKTAILSKLTAGILKGTIIICLPGSTSAARDALQLLIPTIFHSFHMMKGEGH